MHDASDGSGLTILVADDDPAIRKLIGDLLKARGYGVAEAPDGIAACEAAEGAPPALVLLDVLLPKRDGYAVLLHLRSCESTRDVPVVLMSGESEKEQAAIARTLGAHSFLAKPFTLANLHAAVESAIQSGSRSADREPS